MRNGRVTALKRVLVNWKKQHNASVQCTVAFIRNILNKKTIDLPVKNFEIINKKRLFLNMINQIVSKAKQAQQILCEFL